MLDMRALRWICVGFLTAVVAKPVVAVGQETPAVQASASQASVSQASAGEAKAARAFEVASMRLSDPGDGAPTFPTWGSPRFVARRLPLVVYLQLAYGVEESQIEHQPSWMESELVDVEANAADDVALTPALARPMMKELLEERLHLVVHRETRMVKGFALVAAKHGTKLEPAKPTDEMAYILSNGIQSDGITMNTFAKMLTRSVHEPVIDATGVAGYYKVDLKFAAKEDENSDLPSLFVALEEQMGLRLEPRTIPQEFVVIDHIDKTPVAN